MIYVVRWKAARMLAAAGRTSPESGVSGPPRELIEQPSHYFWVRISTSIPCAADATFQTVT